MATDTDGDMDHRQLLPPISVSGHMATDTDGDMDHGQLLPRTNWCQLTTIQLTYAHACTSALIIVSRIVIDSLEC